MAQSSGSNSANTDNQDFPATSTTDISSRKFTRDWSVVNTLQRQMSN